MKNNKSLTIITIVAMMFLYAMISFVTNLAAPVGKIWGASFDDPVLAEKMGMLGNLFNFLAYLIMGIPAGNILAKYGFKRTALFAIFPVSSASAYNGSAVYSIVSMCTFSVRCLADSAYVC